MIGREPWAAIERMFSEWRRTASSRVRMNVGKKEIAMSQHPESTMLAVPVSHGDHILGPETAKITLVEYGDFECPNCGQAYPAVKILRKYFGERMRFVFRHFPLREVHPHAELAAETAESAGAQNKFWPCTTCCSRTSYI